MHETKDYLLLGARFAAVRRAWKRNAALGGLAIVLTEAVGLFTVLLFLDWLYQPQPMVRLGMWVVALAGLGWLTARHVVKPLLRKIPDEQIALYIEEHRAELDGVLITAAEFNRKRDAGDARQNALIDAVIREASQRSARMQISQIADFSRLKKYGIGAVAGIGGYILLGILFPDTFAHHMGRVLAPWQATDEDVAKNSAAAASAAPMQFTLSKGDTSLARGSAFDFEATLSKAKPADQNVVLNFRPKGVGDWQKLPMTEIEKLNGFQGSLPDVSEDIEFYVSCGPDKSETYTLTVYDPLVVQSLETTTHFPDYLKLPDELVRPSSGDVTAVIGSTVTVRILTSTTLKDGQIKWSDGKTQSLSVDPQANSTATVSFSVTQDGTYDYALTDVNGQQAVSPAPLSIHAIPDTPPTIAVKSPQSPLLTHMLGEVNFVAEANDDFGVQSVDLVLSRLDPQGKLQDTRVPLTLSPSGTKDLPNAVQATYRFMLENAQPPFQPNDAITFHLEARDAKGQTAFSPLGFIIVGYFEHWGTWAEPELEGGGAGGPGATGDIMAIMAQIWDLNNDKAQMSADEVKKKIKEVSAKMEDGQGGLLSFVDVEKMPQLTKVAPLIAAHAKSAHDALVAQDTATATAEISIAAAIFAGNGIKLDAAIKPESETGAAAGQSGFNSPQLTMLEQTRLDALAAATADKTHQDSEEAQAQVAADTAKQVDDLIKQQDSLISKAQAAGAGASSQAGNGKGSDSTASSQPKAGDLAAAEKNLADATRKAAEAAKSGSAGATNANLQTAAGKAAEAAGFMEEAARAFAAGKNGEGQDKAGKAKAALSEAGNTLQSSDRDKLEAAISEAENQASVLLDKQRDLNTETSALAKDLGTKTPDQRQQRDLQKQAYGETQLGAGAEALNTEIANLSQWAQQVGQDEAIHALSDAAHVVKRSRYGQQMSGAVVDLNNSNPTEADIEQKSAVDALTKIVASLNDSSDALAASRGAQLNRASRVAQQAKQGLAALLAKATGAAAGAKNQPDKDGKAAGSQAGEQPAKDGKAAGSQAGEQPAKDGKGAEAQAGKDGKAAGSQAGEQPAKDGKGALAQAGDQAGAQHGAGGESAVDQSGGGNEDEVRKLASNLVQLTAVTDNRQLIAQDQVDQLKEMSMDMAALEKRLTVDPKFLQSVSDLVDNISNKIEAELEAKTEAGKLYSSQREECPPAFRQFVNQYFEALSQATPKPGAASAPVPPPPAAQP